MEEENNQQTVQDVKENVTNSLKSFDFKKWGPIIGGAVAAVIVLILVISSLVGGPKKAVKKYISAINSKNAKKMVKCMDYAGTQAWSYRYDTTDFSEDDYEEFIEAYKDVDKDDMDEQIDKAVEYLDDEMDDLKDEYKSFKVKIKEFKSVKKLGKNLYAVKARVHINAVPKDKDDDTIDRSSTVTFVVYKNKLISTGSFF